jgi:hypothetical protein
MSDLVTAALKDLGAAGAAISVLMGTVGTLAAAVVVLWRRGNKVQEETTKARLLERDAFAKIVGDNTAAYTKIADATAQRNRVTEELADAIKAQAASSAMVNERVSFYHADNKEKLKDLSDTVGSMADAVRVNTGMVTDVRNGQVAISQKLERRRS